MREYNPNCLHCCITKAVHDFYKRTGERRGDAIVLDMSEIVAELGKVTAEMVNSAPTRPERRQFQRYAHECLDAGFRYCATGQPQMVNTGGSITEH